MTVPFVISVVEGALSLVFCMLCLHPGQKCIKLLGPKRLQFIIIIIYLLSKNISNDKSFQQKSLHEQDMLGLARVSTYSRPTRMKKENNLHKLTDSLNSYV